MPPKSGYGGPLRTGMRDLADSPLGDLDFTGTFFGTPTPEVNYEEQPYVATNAPRTREALGQMRAQGPSPADLKTRAALDSQARALAMRGQQAAGPLGAQQALAGGAAAQRNAIMAGSQQRAMEEQARTQAIMQALEGERSRMFAASRAENQRRYALEHEQRRLFDSASEKDFDRLSKQMALGGAFLGDKYQKGLGAMALKSQDATHTNLPGYDSFGNKLAEKEWKGRAAPRPGAGLGSYSSNPVEIR